MAAEIPKPTGKDKALALGAGVVGAVPVVGSLAQSIFQLCVVPPFQRKTQTFFEDVAATLTRHGVAIERLADDERFHDAAMQAAIVAGRTRDDVKRCALRNAVVNVVKRTEDDAHTDLFLGWVEGLSPTHLLALEFLDGPQTWCERRQVSWANEPTQSGALSAATGIPRDVVDPLLAELRASGLIEPPLRGVQLPENPLKRRTTEMGRRFLAFVREPTDEAKTVTGSAV